MILPGWSALHSHDQPCSFAMNGQSKGHQHQGNQLVSIITGLLFPGSAPSGGPPWKCGWPLTLTCLMGPTSAGGWLEAGGGLL